MVVQQKIIFNSSLLITRTTLLTYVYTREQLQGQSDRLELAGLSRTGAWIRLSSPKDAKVGRSEPSMCPGIMEAIV